MGGSFGQGNIHPTSEFNIAYDPVAAHIVLHSNIPITMLPLDLTHQVLVTEQITQKISSLSSKFSQTMLGLLNYFQSTYRGSLKTVRFKSVLQFSEQMYLASTVLLFMILVL